jgi:hypothetical protein
MNKTIVAVSTSVLVMGILFVTLPFVSLPSQTTQVYVVPKSEVVVHWGWLPIAAVDPSTSMAKGADLKAGEHYKIQVNATAGKDINFYVHSGLTGLAFPYTGTASQIAYQNVTTIDVDWVAPLNSTYSFVFNSTNLFSYKDANITVTKEWNETAYTEVTEKVPLLPPELVYVGLVILVIASAILLFAKITKKRIFHLRKGVKLRAKYVTRPKCPVNP